MNSKINKSGWIGGAASLLASAAGLVCPACLPAAAGFLASLGIGVAASERFMRPVLIGLLALAVVAFAWSAKRHRRWWIVAAGTTGGVLVYLGRYYAGFGALWVNDGVLWTGAVLLIGTSLANLRYRRGCDRCATAADPSVSGKSHGNEKGDR